MPIRGATSAPHGTIVLSGRRALRSGARRRHTRNNKPSDRAHAHADAFRLCPFSRAIRLALAEHELEVELVEERPWEWRPEFLALNPAGELPVLQLEGGPRPVRRLRHLRIPRRGTPAADADEAARGAGAPAVPRRPRCSAPRSRRLIDWFNGKFNREVTHELLQEKVYARLQPGADRRRPTSTSCAPSAPTCATI